MRMYLENLDVETLKKVHDNNEGLDYAILDDMIDTEMLYITNDYLPCIEDSLSDWSIGVGSPNYIVVHDRQKFVQGVIKLQEDYGFLHDKENEFILNLSNKISKLNQLDEYLYPDKYDKLESEIDMEVEQLTDKIASRFTEMLDYVYDRENRFNYFIEFYLDSRMDKENFYIKKEDDTFELFEDVSFTRSYAMSM